MKLHLPKVLFTAVIAAVCCVQQAMAGVETKTYTINGESVNVTTYTGTETYMNPNRELSADTADNIIAFETTGGHFIQGGFETNRDIYISKGGATDDTKTGLVLSDGWGGNVYTFTGNIYGDGDIYKYNNPPTGVTLKFTGDMSSFTGRIITEGANASNKLIFENTTTGTGSISSNGDVTMNNATIKNSSITITNGALVISGNTSFASTEGIVEATTINVPTLKLSTTVDTSSGKVILSGGSNNNNRVIITAADILDGKFTGEVTLNTQNGTGHVDGNGHLRVDDLMLFSDTSNVSFNGSLDYTVAGQQFNDRKLSDIDATCKTAYIVNESATYSTETMTTDCKFIALNNGATLTLGSSLPTGVTEIYVRAAGSTVLLDGEETVLNNSVMNVKSGASVKITGDGQYVLKTQSFTDGVSLGSKEEWTGSVVYNYTGNNSLNLSTELAKLANDKSSLVLNGVKGYFGSSNELSGRTLELKDNDDGTTPALEICNGSSASSYEAVTTIGVIYANLTGSGSVKYTFNGTDAYSKLAIRGDISGWDGEFEYAKTRNLQLTLTEKAKDVNAAIAKSTENGKLDLVVDNAGNTTTFNNTVNATSVSTTASSSVKLGKGGDMTTDSFSLGEGGTLTLAGGTLTVTDSITLSTVTVDFSQYFDAAQLVNNTYSVDLVTAGGINDWAGEQTGTYTADGTKYTTTVDLDGNSIVLTFKGPDDALTVDELSLNDGVLTLIIDKDLTDMTGAIDLTLSDAALATLAGLPAGEVSLLLQGTAGTPIDSLDYGAAISFYGAYVGEGNGWYKVEYIPEPASATLSLAALMMLAARRRRRA